MNRKTSAAEACRPVGAWRVIEVRDLDGMPEYRVTQITDGLVMATCYQESVAGIVSSSPDLVAALQGYLDDCTNEECERCIVARDALKKAGVA